MSIGIDGSWFGITRGMDQIDLSSMRPRPFGIGGRNIEEVACKLANIPAG